jgi:hypothetical protein
VDAPGPQAREAALSAAAASLDAELEQTPVDEYFTLILRACARGGCEALLAFCDAVEHPVKGVDEAPALALVGVVAAGGAADRAVRAVTWAMAAQRAGETWARRDMLLVIPPWTACFIRGIGACDEHLRELEQRHPGLVPRSFE